MKCTKCDEKIPLSVNECPKCDTSIPDKRTVEDFHVLEEQELNLTDTNVSTSQKVTAESSSHVHENPWDAKENEEPENSSLDESRDTGFNQKIEAIPSDEYDIIRKGIKETFETGEEISDATMNALKHYKFTEFDIHQLVMLLFEESDLTDESSTNREKPSWLVDSANAMQAGITGAEMAQESEPEEKSEEELAIEKAASRKKKKAVREALSIWKEYEEEATHEHQAKTTETTSEKRKSQKRGQILYSNLHPRRHKGKIAIIFVLMMFFILLQPTLDAISPTDKETEENSLKKSTSEKQPLSSQITPPKQASDPQLKPDTWAEYNSYFDYFDSSPAQKTDSITQTSME